MHFQHAEELQVALNMMSKLMSTELKEDGILVRPVHPGWVQTEMGGPQAWISTETSVQGTISVVCDPLQNEQLVECSFVFSGFS